MGRAECRYAECRGAARSVYMVVFLVLDETASRRNGVAPLKIRERRRHELFPNETIPNVIFPNRDWRNNPKFFSEIISG